MVQNSLHIVKLQVHSHILSETVDYRFTLSRTPLTPSPCATQFSYQIAIPHYSHPYVEIMGPGRLNPRSNFCNTEFFLQGGNRTQVPHQSNFHHTTAALGAEAYCGVRFGMMCGFYQLRSPGLPTATFEGPSRALVMSLLTLSGPKESKPPQLPMAAAPGEASNHRTSDGERSPKTKPHLASTS